MAGQEIDKKAKTVELKAKSKREFFLLHGYTGSPTDFNNLGKYLNKRFNANVKIIRLKGHGEKIENIDSLDYKDFLIQAEEELKKEIAKGMEIIIGGISIGSFIALQLSTKYPVHGIISVSNPYRYRLFTGILSFFEPIVFKKHWKKPIPDYEKGLRKNAFYYDTNLRGVKIIKQGKKEVDRILNKVKAPCLIVHVLDENIFHEKGARLIRDKIKSKIKKIYYFRENGKASHNPFYAINHKKVNLVIGNFVEDNKLFKIK